MIFSKAFSTSGYLDLFLSKIIKTLHQKLLNIPILISSSFLLLSLLVSDKIISLLSLSVVFLSFLSIKFCSVKKLFLVDEGEYSLFLWLSSFNVNKSLSLLPLLLVISFFDLLIILGGFPTNFLLLLFLNILSFNIKLNIKNSLEKQSKTKVNTLPIISNALKTPRKLAKVESNCSYCLSKKETLELRTNSK